MQKKIFAGFVAAAVFMIGVMVSSGAHATYSCNDATYGVGGSYANYSSCVSGNTKDKNGTTATAQDVLRTAVAQTSGLLSQRIAAATSGSSAMRADASGFSASSGLSGGKYTDGMGTWVSGAWTTVDDNNAATEHDGEIFNVMVGVDKKISDRVLVGLAIGYEDASIDTQFNQSEVTLEDGSVDSDGYSVSPYFNYRLSQYFSLQVAGGYSWLSYDNNRFDQGDNTRFTSTTDAERYFVGGQVSAFYPRGNWLLGANAGILYANEEKDAFSETNGTLTVSVGEQENELTQAHLEGRIGYQFASGFTPYILGGAQFDLDESTLSVGSDQVTPETEQTGGVYGAGFTYGFNNAVTAGLEARGVERDEISEYTVQGNVRVNF